MEYLHQLREFQKSEQKFVAILEASAHSAVTTGSVLLGITRKLETARRHAMENHDKELQKVQRLEVRLEINRALDQLEGLVVACMFELTKMNRSQIGYSLWKPLCPPRRTLEWKKVVEYAFLADFDLLCDAHQDISTRPWATPAGRLAMDQHFKICRAREEIERLDVEIRRVATYLQDENQYLRDCEDQVSVHDPKLAHQIALHRCECGRFNKIHISRLLDISRLHGFTGTILRGQSTQTWLGESGSKAKACIDNVGVGAGPNPSKNGQYDVCESEGAEEQDLEEQRELKVKEEDKEDKEEALQALENIVNMSDDV
ncbi:hypothetical protein SERLA73DRAFT_76033 [Serpula lacrymans var. lacrymans S7.3]|uniref:Uncharacterized protein n=2 Tax=Serpula lacrymans var. lacrymans TaxID=341189 RepID=F8Q5Z7_SERL3|nr:uncharacterized protein SERLADRAFT_440809 [Serpula lacrymans var. lacrymans S7.9]EGN96035.1 hypothetical protein SERLA73DRAFT_76033 [Serpula lacrymans var. lacrymans S7.3]EGO21559.1 hypothetical protein SERLADRAFT_440809 [Serpula lacrymans var. lacrymans S7.9]